MPGTPMAFDGSGRLYYAFSKKVYRLDTSGTLTVIAGTGAFGYSGDGGPATSATFQNLGGVAVDGSGNLFVTDAQAQVIRKIDTSGIISSLNGNGGNQCCLAGDGGSVSAAKFNSPGQMTFDASGNLFVSDRQNGRVRMIQPSAAGVIDRSSLIWTMSGGPGASADGELYGGGNLSELCADNCDEEISSATAEYAETQTDLQIPGRGIPLAFTRTYARGFAGTAGPLGYGWTHGYSMSLRVDPDSNNVVIRQENGSQLTYSPNGSGGFLSPPRQL